MTYLQVSGSDSLDLEILGGISCQLEDLGGEILEDGGAVDGGGGSNTTCGETAALQVTVDPEKQKLKLASFHIFSIHKKD